MSCISIRIRHCMLLAGIVVLNVANLRSQCPPDEKFPYQFCKEGRIVLRCESDPHHVWEDGVQLIPFRRYIPGCLTIDQGRQFDIYMPKVGTGGGAVYIPVYRISDESKDITDAFNQWNGLCPESGGPFDCCVHISFSANAAEFGGREIAIRVSPMAVDPTTCRPTCADERRIDINDSRVFLYGSVDADPNDEITRSFFTGRLPPSIARPYEAYSLYQAIEAKAGVWFGLPGGEDAAFSGCSHPNAVMENSITEGIPYDLTDADKCQFRKLYCDHEVGLGVDDPPQPTLTFNVVPNPTRNSVTLRIPDDVPYSSALTVRLVDAAGRTVREMRVENSAGEIRIDLGDAVDGAYMLVLADGVRAHGEKILVRR